MGFMLVAAWYTGDCLIHDSIWITGKPKNRWDDIKMEQGVEKLQLAQYAPVAANENMVVNPDFHKKNYTY